ncbi:MAG TPA: TolC family protein, partial [Parasegetibacter sp.]
ITVTDTLYPAEIISEDFNLLDSMINANDPLIALYAQEAAVLKQHVALQKSLNLPKLEAGYHSQRQFPQSFRGIHAGISIPLWEGKNKLKATRLEQAHAEDLVRVQRLESRSQNRQLYETVKVRQRSLEEYKAILGSMNTRYLLDKSLRLGEIDLTSYFKEENEYYDAYEDFLRIEFEYHEAVARLRRYQL